MPSKKDTYTDGRTQEYFKLQSVEIHKCLPFLPARCSVIIMASNDAGEVTPWCFHADIQKNCSS